MTIKYKNLNFLLFYWRRDILTHRGHTRLQNAPLETIKYYNKVIIKYQLNYYLLCIKIINKRVI